MTTPTPPSIDQFRELFHAAVAKHINEFDAEAFSRSIIEDLNQRKREAILAVLGIERRFGAYEVYRNNGQETVTTRAINDAVRPFLTEWLNEAITEVIEADKERLRRPFQDAVRRRLKDLLHDEAYRATNTLAAKLVGEWSEELRQEFRK